jgi:hypothetical protein
MSNQESRPSRHTKAIIKALPPASAATCLICGSTTRVTTVTSLISAGKIDLCAACVSQDVDATGKLGKKEVPTVLVTAPSTISGLKRRKPYDVEDDDPEFKPSTKKKNTKKLHKEGAGQKPSKSTTDFANGDISDVAEKEINKETRSDNVILGKPTATNDPLKKSKKGGAGKKPSKSTTEFADGDISDGAKKEINNETRSDKVILGKPTSANDPLKKSKQWGAGKKLLKSKIEFVDAPPRSPSPVDYNYITGTPPGPEAAAVETKQRKKRMVHLWIPRAHPLREQTSGKRR